MVKKHQIALMLNKGASTSPVWTRIKKSTELTISMNPETEENDYIADESPTTELKNYKPSIDQDLTMMKGEDDYEMMFATVYKGNIIKNLIMDCQSYTKYRPNETTGGIFVSWRRKEELPTGA